MYSYIVGIYTSAFYANIYMYACVSVGYIKPNLEYHKDKCVLSSNIYEFHNRQLH